MHAQEISSRREFDDALAEANREGQLIGWARERAHEQAFERLAPQLTDAVCAKLDGLLIADGGQSRRAWLRSGATPFWRGGKLPVAPLLLEPRERFALR